MTGRKKTDTHDNGYVSSDIYDSEGILLIAKGTLIDEKVIRFCQKRNIEIDRCYKDQDYTEEKGKIPSEKLVKDSLVKFNFINQNYASYAPELVSESMKNIANKKIAPFDLSVLYKKTHWVFAHSINVALLSAIFAYKLRINEADIQKIVIAALLHDIGKTIIPSAIVNKTGDLSPEEKLLLQRHPQLGSDILADLGIDKEITLIVKQHHELLNGSGYSEGISQGLHKYTQLIGVANKFDFLLSDTHFKRACSLIDALEEMERKKGTEYDAAIINVLFQVFEKRKSI